MPELRKESLAESTAAAKAPSSRRPAETATAYSRHTEGAMKLAGNILMIAGGAMYLAAMLASFGIPKVTTEAAVNEAVRILTEVILPVGAIGIALFIPGILIRLRADRRAANRAAQSAKPAS